MVLNNRDHDMLGSIFLGSPYFGKVPLFRFEPTDEAGSHLQL